MEEQRSEIGQKVDAIINTKNAEIFRLKHEVKVAERRVKELEEEAKEYRCHIRVMHETCPDCYEIYNFDESGECKVCGGGELLRSEEAGK